MQATQRDAYPWLNSLLKSRRATRSVSGSEGLRRLTHESARSAMHDAWLGSVLVPVDPATGRPPSANGGIWKASPIGDGAHVELLLDGHGEVAVKVVVVSRRFLLWSR
eukprot:14245154-Alexandrium_andersonii.AAC.1